MTDMVEKYIRNTSNNTYHHHYYLGEQRFKDSRKMKQTSYV